MVKFNSKTAISVSTLLVSLVWFCLGLFKYGVWDDASGPASGFFPVIIASVLLLCSIVGILQSFRESGAKYDRQALYVIGGIVTILAMCWLIGMLPALLIFFVGWLIVVEKMPVKTIVISTVIMSAIIYGVFKLWLGVPFPEGLLFEMLIG